MDGRLDKKIGGNQNEIAKNRDSLIAAWRSWAEPDGIVNGAKDKRYQRPHQRRSAVAFPAEIKKPPIAGSMVLEF